MEYATISVYTNWDYPIPERTYTWHGKKHWPVRVSMGAVSEEELKELPWKLVFIESDPMRMVCIYRRADLNIFTGSLYYIWKSFTRKLRIWELKWEATRKIWCGHGI